MLRLLLQWYAWGRLRYRLPTIVLILRRWVGVKRRLTRVIRLWVRRVRCSGRRRCWLDEGLLWVLGVRWRRLVRELVHLDLGFDWTLTRMNDFTMTLAHSLLLRQEQSCFDNFREQLLFLFKMFQLYLFRRLLVCLLALSFKRTLPTKVSTYSTHKTFLSSL